MISFVVAMDENRVIGKDNALPWHLPADLAYFKQVTMGKPILMGRKTHESIGRALPGRENIILTRNTNYQSATCTVIHDLGDVQRLSQESEQELCVIGGAELFRELLSTAAKLYMTQIHHEFEGDTYFPEVDWKEWTVIDRKQGVKDEKNPYDYEYVIYERMT
ncbi:dihydrofolate reductase [Bacillus sp. DJP31]|uniref:dihydrofolate reductase n=1 Tax=Bacillus sp. DJP31 TaxID=3409789 RepID=UPI003BB602D7